MSLTCDFLPCGLELVGSWVIPVDVDRAGNRNESQEQDWFPPCLRGDEAGCVVVAVFSDLASAFVRTFIHLKFVAAIHLKRI